MKFMEWFGFSNKKEHKSTAGDNAPADRVSVQDKGNELDTVMQKSTNLAEFVCYTSSMGFSEEDIASYSGQPIEDVREIIKEAKQEGLFEEFVAKVKNR